MAPMQPGTLWPAVVARTQLALARGAIERIETAEAFIEEAGVRFLVRRVSSLARKDEEGKRARRPQASPARHDPGNPSSPFLPPEPDLLVCEVTDTHLALLNKFNVIDNHLLVVTRKFAHQEILLDERDFTALAACMAEFEGLGFYNGGAAAGASQPHKHLQVVPLPLASEGPGVPVEPWFDPLRGQSGVLRVPALPFAHAFAWIDPAWFGEARSAGTMLHARYRELLHACGLREIAREGQMRQSAPYNLLLTRRWMLLVPRSMEHFESISVNALGFAGSLFVRTPAQLQAVERAGPLQVLRAVAAGRKRIA